MDWIPDTPLDWLQVAVAWLGLSLFCLGLWMVASYGRRAIRCVECREIVCRGRMPPVTGLCDGCADRTAARANQRRASLRRAERVS